MEEIFSLRERKKQQTREALEAAAWRLFQRKGYDETTIEDITDAVDVSPRTFFRYYDSKEAVLFGDWQSDLQKAGELFLSRQADEHPLVALREATMALAERFEAQRTKYLFLKKLAETSKNVGDYERNVIVPKLEELMTQGIALYMGVNPGADLRPSVYASTALAALHTAKKTWLARDGDVSLAELVQQTFDIILDPLGEDQGVSI